MFIKIKVFLISDLFSELKTVLFCNNKNTLYVKRLLSSKTTTTITYLPEQAVETNY